MSYYDQNYGHWENMEEPGMVEFYHQVQKNSVLKQCSICGDMVKIQPHYDKCNDCCDKIESGWSY